MALPEGRYHGVLFTHIDVCLLRCFQLGFRSERCLESEEGVKDVLVS